MADDKERGGKRKRFDNARQQFGSRNKKKELGRGSFSRQKFDKRAQNEEQAEKRQRLDAKGNARPSVLPGPFLQEDIDKEGRRPKHKVAVLVGYSGTGYRGMQINTTERTIEGDLFSAFVNAGAISKANATDPKKSGLVRCARTDKGVHAAGNVVSLKLIVEDADIVQRINSHLSEQIRVWGIQRTVGSFSCYQACDSRWYEYLIPSHAFLPPHPNSFLGKKLADVAEEVGDSKGFRDRQEEVCHFWDHTETTFIKPIVDKLRSPLKELVLKALYEAERDEGESDRGVGSKADVNGEAKLPGGPMDSSASISAEADNIEWIRPSSDVDKNAPPEVCETTKPLTTAATDSGDAHERCKAAIRQEIVTKPAHSLEVMINSDTETPPTSTEGRITSERGEPDDPLERLPAELRKEVEITTKKLRHTYLQAKRLYRIPSSRMARIHASLTKFIGTQNFHNYTVQKAPNDPSAKRLIKSFTLDPEPKIINGTEWLSLKIHGQSFMMHQIRKMISALTLVVRCGCPLERITETLRADVSISIPKVPGLGLLLERPVFQSYNDHTAVKFEREKIDFSKFDKEMGEFKQHEIYERIFREEEEGHAFFTFFGHVDGYKESAFLWVTSKGVEATDGGRKGKSDAAGFESQRSRGMEPIRQPLKDDLESEDEEDVRERGRADMDG